MLIPAKLLVNDGSIVQERGWSHVVYYHVELSQHSVIYAEDLAAESYLDTGNRTSFENGGALMMLHPDFSISSRLQLRENASCLPFVVAPSVVQPIWNDLVLRSGEIGFPTGTPEAISEPNLRLRMATRDLLPLSVSDDNYLFMLPPGTREVRLESRSARPNETRPWIDDIRRLGVRVGQISVKDGFDVIDIPLDGPALNDGWWAVEIDATSMSRWTNGDARLALPPGDNSGRMLALKLAGSNTYPIAQVGEVLPARKVA